VKCEVSGRAERPLQFSLFADADGGVERRFLTQAPFEGRDELSDAL
jgi:hypothetical protein